MDFPNSGSSSKLGSLEIQAKCIKTSHPLDASISLSLSLSNQTERAVVLAYSYSCGNVTTVFTISRQKCKVKASDLINF